MIDYKKYFVPDSVIFGNILVDDKFLCHLQLNQTWVCITDKNVAKTKLFNHLVDLLNSKVSLHLEVIEAGEASKNYANKIAIEHTMLELGLRRNVGILAVGGGVVLDLAGFVASTYCRGIPWLAVPTSLMAMVDVCVGGKTGINTIYGKNTLGAIYPAGLSFIDVDWLASLPEFEYQWALPEVVKMAAITDCANLNWLDINYNLIKQYQPCLEIELMIKASIGMKHHFIKKDLYDFNTRQFLNFGHTLAHALELYFDWQITHGQAVALGLIYAVELSSCFYPEFVDKFFLKKLLIKLNCNFTLSNELDIEKLWRYCLLDKKINQNGQLQWVGLKQFGEPCFLPPVSQSQFFDSFYLSTTCC